ncbi:MAG: transcriptional regulator [Meiothermus sp.]
MSAIVEIPPMVEVRNPLAARILADPDVALWLKPFMKAELSVKEAAETLKVPLQTLHYRVEQMVEAGLLEVVGLEARRGRPIKRYRATATGFKVPLDLIPPRMLEDLESAVFWSRQLQEGLERTRRLPKYRDHLTVYLNEHGLMIFGSSHEKVRPKLLGDDEPAVLSLWTIGLHLTREDAKALQAELWEIYQRYHKRQGPERYVLHLGMAPHPDGR